MFRYCIIIVGRVQVLQIVDTHIQYRFCNRKGFFDAPEWFLCRITNPPTHYLNWPERAAFQRSAFGRSTAGNDVVATIFISLFFFFPRFFFSLVCQSVYCASSLLFLSLSCVCVLCVPQYCLSEVKQFAENQSWDLKITPQ